MDPDDGLRWASDAERLHAVIDELNHGDIESVLDVDGALRFVAVSALLVNLDSYLGTGHNYYLYEEDGVFTYIPWDMNMSFGGFTCTCSPQDLKALYVYEPTCAELADRPLVDRLLQDDARRATYGAYLTELIGGLASVEAMTERVEQAADLIRPYVQADPTKFYSADDFETNLYDDLVQGNKQIFGLISFIRDRGANVAAQLAAEATSSNPGEGSCEATFGPK